MTLTMLETAKCEMKVGEFSDGSGYRHTVRASHSEAKDRAAESYVVIEDATGSVLINANDWHALVLCVGRCLDAVNG